MKEKILPPNGSISLSMVNTELGHSQTTNISMGSKACRDLAQIPAGTISLSSFYGKSSFPSRLLSIYVEDATYIQIKGDFTFISEVSGYEGQTEHSGADIKVILPTEDSSFSVSIYYDNPFTKNNSIITDGVRLSLSGEFFSEELEMWDLTAMQGNLGTSELVFNMPKCKKMMINPNWSQLFIYDTTFEKCTSLEDITSIFEGSGWVSVYSTNMFKNCPIKKIDRAFWKANIAFEVDSSALFMDKNIVSCNGTFVLETNSTTDDNYFPLLWAKFQSIPHDICYAVYKQGIGTDSYTGNYTPILGNYSSIVVPIDWYSK